MRVQSDANLFGKPSIVSGQTRDRKARSVLSGSLNNILYDDFDLLSQQMELNRHVETSLGPINHELYSNGNKVSPAFVECFWHKEVGTNLSTLLGSRE